jgi:hypothetical protein
LTALSPAQDSAGVWICDGAGELGRKKEVLSCCYCLHVRAKKVWQHWLTALMICDAAGVYIVVGPRKGRSRIFERSNANVGLYVLHPLYQFGLVYEWHVMVLPTAGIRPLHPFPLPPIMCPRMILAVLHYANQRSLREISVHSAAKNCSYLKFNF